MWKTRIVRRRPEEDLIDLPDEKLLDSNTKNLDASREEKLLQYYINDTGDVDDVVKGTVDLSSTEFNCSNKVIADVVQDWTIEPKIPSRKVSDKGANQPGNGLGI